MNAKITISKNLYTAKWDANLEVEGAGTLFLGSFPNPDYAAEVIGMAQEAVADMIAGANVEVIREPVRDVRD